MPIKINYTIKKKVPKDNEKLVGLYEQIRNGKITTYSGNLSIEELDKVFYDLFYNRKRPI